MKQKTKNWLIGGWMLAIIVFFVLDYLSDFIPILKFL